MDNHAGEIDGVRLRDQLKCKCVTAFNADKGIHQKSIELK
jgi:hypothetical protein